METKNIIFFEKMIDIENLKKDISNLNETKAFINGVSGYILIIA